MSLYKPVGSVTCPQNTDIIAVVSMGKKEDKMTEVHVEKRPQSSKQTQALPQVKRQLTRRNLIGIVVGAVVGFLLLVALIVALVLTLYIPHPDDNVSLPDVKKLHYHHLDIKAGLQVGMSSDYILLEKADGSGKMKMLRRTGDVEWEEMWSKYLPRFLVPKSNKAILSNGDIVIKHPTENTTHLLTSDLEPRDEFKGDFGWLQSSLPNDRLLYSKKIRSKPFVDIFDARSHSHLMLLDAGWKSQYMYGCGHPSGFIAVTDFLTKTLSIFNPSGQLVVTEELYFKPNSVNGMAAVGDWIFIISEDPEGLSVHNWSGKQLGLLRQQDLGMDQYTYPRGVVSGGGNRLHVLAGSVGYNVKSIYTFEVSHDDRYGDWKV